MGLIISKRIGTYKNVTTPYSAAKAEVVNDLGEVVEAAIPEVAEVFEMVDALIIIKGTNIDLNSVYGRVQCECPLNGVKQPVNVKYYQNEADYNNGVAEVALNLETDFGSFDVPQGEYQGIELAHELFANKLISLGYSVEIIL
jgi:hypothetical protein